MGLPELPALAYFDGPALPHNRVADYPACGSSSRTTTPDASVIASSASLSVVLLAFDPRNNATLKRVVCHYAAMRVVSEVVLVWNGRDAPPVLRCAVECRRSPPRPALRPCDGDGAQVSVARMGSNTLLNRYAVWARLKTDAVLLTDDDVLMCADGVGAMLAHFVRYPRQLIGVNMRSHASFPLRRRRKSGLAHWYFYHGRGLGTTEYSSSTGQMNLVGRAYLRAFMEHPSARCKRVPSIFLAMRSGPAYATCAPSSVAVLARSLPGGLAAQERVPSCTRAHL